MRITEGQLRRIIKSLINEQGIPLNRPAAQGKPLTPEQEKAYTGMEKFFDFINGIKENKDLYAQFDEYLRALGGKKVTLSKGGEELEKYIGANPHRKTYMNDIIKIANLFKNGQGQQANAMLDQVINAYEKTPGEIHHNYEYMWNTARVAGQGRGASNLSTY